MAEEIGKMSSKLNSCHQSSVLARIE